MTLLGVSKPEDEFTAEEKKDYRLFQEIVADINNDTIVIPSGKTKDQYINTLNEKSKQGISAVLQQLDDDKVMYDYEV